MPVQRSAKNRGFFADRCTGIEVGTGLGVDEQLGYLHGVERRTLAKIVIAHEKCQPTLIGHTRVLANPTNE